MKRFLHLIILCLLNGMFYANTKPAIGFIENKGQIHDQNFKPNTAVKYLLSVPGMNLQLKQNSFSYDTYTVEQKNTETTRETPLAKLKRPAVENTYHFHRVDVEFIGASAQPEIIAESPSETYYNYYTTGTSEQGATNVRSYEKVTYKNIYPNIDLEFIAKDGKMKYNFILHYGADMSVIKWKYHGADNSEIKNNNISIAVKHGEFKETIPESYVSSNSKIVKQVKVEFTKNASGVYGFKCNQKIYLTMNENLVIDPDPVLLWSTYFGGTLIDELTGSCIDDNSNIYAGGYSESNASIATAGAFQSSFAGGVTDAVIAKFNTFGALKWATYYGSSGKDEGTTICIDKNANIFFSGTTSSTLNIATSGAHQTIYGGGPTDVFISKFDTNGVRQWATYYGGSGDEYNYFCRSSIDSLGNLYLCSATSSTNSIATSGCHQSNYGGGTFDCFIVKLNTNGVRQWATYYGGNSEDAGYSCVNDSKGNLYLTGVTTSSNAISSIGSHQVGYSGGGQFDGFVAKFNTNGTFRWGSYYGASNTKDRALLITYDPKGKSIYFGGDTYSIDSIATLGSHQPTYGGALDAYLVKMDTNGVRQWGTYYGGTGFDYFVSIVTDSTSLYLGGASRSAASISTSTAWQTTYTGGPYGDAIIIKFDKAGNRLWGTYFGGNFWDCVFSILLNKFGDIFTTGCTSSTTLPVTSGAYQILNKGLEDGFCAKFRQNIATLITQNDINENIFNIYPNPNSGSFTIQTKEDVVLEIVNEIGQLVKTVKLDAGNNHQTTITGLADGVYCLKDKLSGAVIKNKIVVVR